MRKLEIAAAIVSVHRRVSLGDPQHDAAVLRQPDVLHAPACDVHLGLEPRVLPDDPHYPLPHDVEGPARRSAAQHITVHRQTLNPAGVKEMRDILANQFSSFIRLPGTYGACQVSVQADHSGDNLREPAPIRHELQLLVNG